MAKPVSVETYIASFAVDVQSVLKHMRAIIKTAAPHAEEVISYSTPAFKLHGMLVWYGAHTNHIGFYPRASVIETFKNDLVGYKCTKGTIQFPFNQPLPEGLITKIINFRVAENLQKVRIKKK